jgi:hypothetical protein
MAKRLDSTAGAQRSTTTESRSTSDAANRGVTVRALPLIALFLATSIISTGMARAGVVLLDNTGNLTSWNSASPSNFSGNYASNAKVLGMTFVTGPTSYDLTSISVAMAYGNGSLAPTMQLSMFENGSTSDTKPTDAATPTYSQDFSGFTFTGTQQIYTFSPSTTWNLKANTSYSFWLGTSETNFTNNAALRWYQASSSASSTLGFTQTGGFYSSNGGASYSAPGNLLSMQVTGSAASAGVPEIDPATGSTALSLVAGLLAMMEQRRRRATRLG